MFNDRPWQVGGWVGRKVGTNNRIDHTLDTMSYGVTFV